tara:strand:- start:325 stop:894 length:570 start_codon:yes stop_codon:yes gene_type:complete
MNDEEVKKNRTLSFLNEFRKRLRIPFVGTKEGLEAKYDESKKDLFGFPLPEYGISEYLNLPNLLERRQEILEKKEKEKKEAKQEDLGKATGDTKTARMLATEALIREVENRFQNRRDLNFMSQSLPIVDTYAETAMQRALQADRFSPTKISQQRLRAQTGEAALMQAIANQASAGAQIGGLGTGRRYGR